MGSAGPLTFSPLCALWKKSTACCCLCVFTVSQHAPVVVVEVSESLKSQRGRSQSCPQDEFKVQQQHRAELLLTAWWTQTSFIQELRSVCTFCLHASRGSLTHIDARLRSPPAWVAGFDCVLKMLHSADVWVTHGLYFSKIQIDVAPAVERLRLKFNKHSKILHLHEENLCQTKALLLGAEISWWS